MTLHKLLPLFVLLLNLLLLGTALASGRDNRRNIWFARLCMALALWSFGALGLRWSETVQAAVTWERVLHLGVVAIPFLFCRYALALIGAQPNPPSLVVGGVIGAFFAAAIFTPAFMRGVEQTVWGYAPSPGPLYGAFFAYFQGYMLLGLGWLVQAQRGNGSSFRRNRIRLVIVGVGMSFAGGMVDFARFLFDLEWVYPAGMPAAALFGVALGVAIVRYRLVALSTIAKRIVLHAVLALSLAPVLILAVDLVGTYVPVAFAPASTYPTVLIIVMLLALPALRRFEDALDRVMFSRERAVRDALVSLSGQLSGTLESDTLAYLLTTELAQRIPVTHATLYERDAGTDVLVPVASGRAKDSEVPGGVDPSFVEMVDLVLRTHPRTLVVDEIGYRGSADAVEARLLTALESAGVALVLPLRAGGEVAAILVVGEKVSGEVFNPAEVEFLEVLGAAAATALKNAQLYETLRSRMEELRASRTAISEAREADRAKDRFIAVLAHELRNPLAPLVNATRVLDRHLEGDASASAMLDIIRRQGQQLARLVEDLLDVSRVRSGKVTIHRQPVDLCHLVTQCLGALNASGKAQGRHIKTALAGEPVVVEADPARLQQVIWNLLDNALKYTPEHGTIRVILGRRDEEAALTISDTGVGMTPEVLETAFELFTQADTSLHRAQGGLGVGLALVRSLVEQHGGSVTAYSGGMGLGSEVVVRLPLVRTPAPFPGVELSSVAGRAPVRVMIVDPNADARESLRAMLELAGYSVTTAPAVPSALEQALRSRPDVALVDVGPAGAEGVRAARELRQTAIGRAMHVIAMVEGDEPDRVREMSASGFDAHVTKPADPEALCRRLSEIGEEPRSFRRGL